VITHLHPDHCVDLMALRVYMVWGPGAGRVLTVHGPPGLRERLMAFSGSYGWDRAFDFRELAAGEGQIEVGDGVVVRHREVPHLPPTHAVRVEHEGRAICFSADCGPNQALVELARGCEVLVCECSFGAERVPEGVPHLDARDAGAMAARAGVACLLLVHCSPEFDREAALAAARDAFGARSHGPARRGRDRVNWFRTRRRPVGRRAMVIAVVLSLLLRGSGTPTRSTCPVRSCGSAARSSSGWS